MIAVDTTVLIRLLVEDDREQALEAARLLESISEKGETCFVGDPVLCELEWVLEAVYNASREDVVSAVYQILQNDIFELEDDPSVETALEQYTQGAADFSDYLLGMRAQSRGARTTYTFDKALRDEPGFTLL